MSKKKTFLICPVRGHKPEETALIVEKLEEEYEVHWPPRDTNQNDKTGLNICFDNRRAIRNADIVHVVWDGKSQGCLFDLGMAFDMQKPIRCISLPSESEGKSFQNMIRAWQEMMGIEIIKNGKGYFLDFYCYEVIDPPIEGSPGAIEKLNFGETKC